MKRKIKETDEVIENLLLFFQMLNLVYCVFLCDRSFSFQKCDMFWFVVFNEDLKIIKSWFQKTLDMNYWLTVFWNSKNSKNLNDNFKN